MVVELSLVNQFKKTSKDITTKENLLGDKNLVREESLKQMGKYMKEFGERINLMERELKFD